MPRLQPYEIAAYARHAGWRGQDVRIAVAVALAESSGNPEAINTSNSNGSTDYGLFQINSVHRGILAGGNWRDPKDNAAMAKRVWDGRSGDKWRAWVAYSTGAYLRHMSVDIEPRPGPGMLPDASGEMPSHVPEAAIEFTDRLTDPGFWQRVGMVLGGGMMVVLGLVALVGKNITKLPLPIGKIAKTVKAVT